MMCKVGNVSLCGRPMIRQEPIGVRDQESQENKRGRLGLMKQLHRALSYYLIRLLPAASHP